MAFNFATAQPTAPSTLAQSNALKNLASGSNLNLVSQLVAGKTPAAQTPATTAAAANVKNVNAPVAFNPQSVFGSTGGATTSATAPAPQTGTFNFGTTPSTLSTYNVATGSSNPLATGTLNNVTPQSQTLPQTVSVAPATTQNDTTYVNPNASSQQINTGAPGTSVTPTTTFGGILGNLAQTSAAGSSQGQAITSNLANTSAQGSAAATAAEQATANAGLLNPALAANAQNIGNQYSTEMNNLVNQEGAAVSGNSTGGGGPIGLGRAGAIEANVGQQLQGEAAAGNFALGANAQGLTAASQQATAENEAGNLANTQQSNVQSGEAAAGGLANTAQQNVQSGEQQAAALAQPSGTFPFVFDPTTGSYSVSGGNLQTAISGGVQQAVSNPALYTSLNNAITSTYGNAAAGMFQQAYINAGGNPNTAAGAAAGAQAVAAAPGQAQAQNIGTTGTAATSAANTAYSAAVQNVSKATAAYTGATGVASNLTTTLGSWLQSGQITNVNAALNKIAGLTSSPEYAQFNTAMTNAQAAYTAAFTSAGITPTQSTINAINELNPNSSASTIVASLNQLSSDLHAATVVPAYQQQTTYASQLGIQ